MSSEFDLELALARVDQERDASLKASRDALKKPGTRECVDCGTDIPPARRRVHPSATRCLPCQEIEEKDASLR